MAQLHGCPASSALAFLYVANDVMQKTRKRGRAYNTEFGMVSRAGRDAGGVGGGRGRRRGRGL